MDAKGLGIKEATVHPKAMENIDAIIDIISKLEKKGLLTVWMGMCILAPEGLKNIKAVSPTLEDLELGLELMWTREKRIPWICTVKAQKPGEPA